MKEKNKNSKENPVHKVPSVGFEPTASGIHLVRLYQAETRKGHGKRPPSPGNGSCWNTLFYFKLVCPCNLPGSGTWSVPWPFPRDPLWQNPLLSVKLFDPSLHLFLADLPHPVPFCSPCCPKHVAYSFCLIQPFGSLDPVLLC